MATFKSKNKRQYSSDSFDRFGDDLSELLLSYLCFEDKFRFECVSKQWQRLVFNKVFDFDTQLFKHRDTNEELDIDRRNPIDRKYLNVRSMTDKQMKTLLNKCPNVKTINLYVIEQMNTWLSLLSDNCHRLKSIELFISRNITSEAMTTFFETVGSKVDAIHSHNLSTKLELLHLCPNLKRLNCYGSDWLCLIGNQLVPTLNTLSHVFVDSDQMLEFSQLVHKYESTMKKFVVSFRLPDSIDSIFQLLCQLPNLEYLQLDHHPYNNIQFDLTPAIVALGQCCPNLSKLNVGIRNIRLSCPLHPINTIKSLSITFTESSDNFFVNLSDLLPNLKQLLLNMNGICKNEDFIDLSRLKHLKILVFWSSLKIIHKTDDIGVIHLLDSCKQIEELDLYFPLNITVKTIDKLKELAKNINKQRIRFSAKVSNDKSDIICNSMNEIPDNLSVIIFPILNI